MIAAMPNDLTLATRGLPAPGGASLTDRTFQWFFERNSLTIPRYQCGQTEFCATDGEQARWLDAHGSQWLHEVWHCTWEWNTPGARDDFMAVLAPLDPLHDEVNSALRELGTTNTADRAQAARALLALPAPNLAAALPALARVLRDADPELRGLAAALLYQWHQRTDTARLPTLFRDDDPVVRAAALLQAQCDFYLDPRAREQLPLILERMADGDPAVRHQALQAVEAAAIKGAITCRRVLELRGEFGPLVDADGVDRSDTLARVADSRGPRTPSAPAMEAFYAALCEVELLRGERPGGDAELRAASDRAHALWQQFLLDAPDEVRLHDTRINILQSADASAQPPDADLLRRVTHTRSPRREFDAAAIYWVHQHTAPRGLPADFVRQSRMQARAVDPRASTRYPREHDPDDDLPGPFR